MASFKGMKIGLLSEAPVWLKIWNLVFDCVLLVLILYAVIHDGPEYRRYAKLCDQLCLQKVAEYEKLAGSNFTLINNTGMQSMLRDLNVSAQVLNPIPKPS